MQLVLADVRDAVTREWSNDKRKDIEDRNFSALLTHYNVVIDGGATAGEEP